LPTRTSDAGKTKRNRKINFRSNENMMDSFKNRSFSQDGNGFSDCVFTQSVGNGCQNKEGREKKRRQTSLISGIAADWLPAFHRQNVAISSQQSVSTSSRQVSSRSSQKIYSKLRNYFSACLSK